MKFFRRHREQGPQPNVLTIRPASKPEPEHFCAVGWRHPASECPLPRRSVPTDFGVQRSDTIPTSECPPQRRRTILDVHR